MGRKVGLDHTRGFEAMLGSVTNTNLVEAIQGFYLQVVDGVVKDKWVLEDHLDFVALVLTIAWS